MRDRGSIYEAEPPKDYVEPQQIILREVVKDSDGGFGRLKDVVFFALIIAVGGIIWNMSQRLASIELLVKILARKSGVVLE